MSSTLYTAEFVMPTLSDNFYLIRALCDVFAWDFETAYEQIEENRGQSSITIIMLLIMTFLP